MSLSSHSGNILRRLARAEKTYQCDNIQDADYVEDNVAWTGQRALKERHYVGDFVSGIRRCSGFEILRNESSWSGPWVIKRRCTAGYYWYEMWGGRCRGRRG